jgi:hypothetical protein
MPRQRVRAFAAALAAAALWLDATAFAQHPQIERGRAREQKHFTDEQIVSGFFKIAFSAELDVGAPAGRIRKYEGPVRVHVESRAQPDRRKDVARVVADIGAHVEHLDIAMTDRRADANVHVVLARNRDLGKIIAELYGRERARIIRSSLDPQCLSGFEKDENFRIRRSTVILAADAGKFIFYDCAYEEILQSLGPINDDESVPWTMFNDDVSKGFFDVYDQYLLNILYHPKVRPGMTREEVRAVLPEVLPQVRAFVERINGIRQ